MKAVDLVRGFCKENEERYSIYEQYSGRGMFGRNCVGIVVKQGYSYMEMLMELTKYLEANDFDDADFELEGVSMDELGLNKIVYFPSMEG